MFAIVLAAAVAALSLDPQVPNPQLTPGRADPAATAAVVCSRGYASRPGVRHVTEATKRKVFAEYRIDPKVGGPYEIDHLISLELGGSNDIANLWPQSYVSQPWNAHSKDALENELHRRVCKGEISLQQAQTAIATAWIAAHIEFLGPQDVDPAR